MPLGAGVEAVITAILQAPQFLYRAEPLDTGGMGRVDLRPPDGGGRAVGCPGAVVDTDKTSNGEQRLAGHTTGQVSIVDGGGLFS